MTDYLNVLEIQDGALIGNSLFTSNEEGEAAFTKLVKKLKPSADEEEISDAIEDGYFEQGKNILFLSHPE